MGLYRPRIVLIKVLSRYLKEKEYKAFLTELASYKRVYDPLFVEIMKRHFDFERWRTAPLIKQDFWLYNHFAFEYNGKLKCNGLMNKYIHNAFIYEDVEFFQSVEELNRKKVPLPRGVKFIPNVDEEEMPKAINYQVTDRIEPKRSE